MNKGDEMNKFWKEYPQLISELNIVREVMKDNIKTREQYLEEAVLPMLEGGGKMLRPAFLLLAAKFGNYDKEKIYNIAAVIEMLHLATLVHDDIIDDSKLRRGTKTIQHKYGKEYAVYIGDYLFTQCIIMISKYDYEMEDLKNISKAISKICMGEIRQYNLKFARNMNLRNYIRIVSGKTAALFALSFYIGANEAECDRSLAKILGKIGYNIGMAFQIMDDLLDFSGDTELLGKSALKDLKRGYYTLPLIYALENDKNDEIKKILAKKELNDEEVIKVIDIVKQLNGIEKAKQLANKYTKRALENVEKLPDSESKEIIKYTVKKLLLRNY